MTASVLEVASLRLKPGVTIDTPALRSGLVFAKAAMEESAGAGRPFRYLQQVEDPSFIYILGAWPSVKYHYDDYIPSAPNQQTLEMLRDLVTVQYLIHADIDPTKVPLDTGLVAVGRHYLKDGQREAFAKAFTASNAPLVDATKGRLISGWRLDQEDEKEEFVLFTAWETLEDHKAFKDESAKVREYLAGEETKHAKVLDI
ncbi:hypothetical protein CYLTODRAFT_426122 [Cylindrobasidium torrendii FP15055 ss-10]|uniref:ABM domain-containing protein n=1 Tax=Cylindrobasidium torrendii FP15055 ss-10 TaxID=1314674 RepID=A0A0D7AYY2_9AGAR|nr:hypothetical protein CYLTODRAFT_426122 [Cylindrobasidium torrendii FP15055 ss-10]